MSHHKTKLLCPKCKEYVEPEEKIFHTMLCPKCNTILEGDKQWKQS